MAISEIVRNRFVSSIKQGIQLRNGQIVQGKILKLFPNNRAQIQIGSQTLVAEITTALEVGNKYFFQVQHKKDQLVHLKVLSDHLGQKSSDINHLMELLGVKRSKNATQFIGLLVNEKILFDRSQVKKALDLLEQFGFKASTVRIVKEMVSNRLPMTEAIFKALSISRTGTLSSLMSELYYTLQQAGSLNETEQKLVNLLEKMLIRPVVKNNSLSQWTTTHLTYIHSLKQTGLLNIPKPFINENVLLEQMTENVKERSLETTRVVDKFVQDKRFQQLVTTLVNNATKLQSTSEQLLHRFPLLQSNSLTDHQLSTLKMLLVERLFSLFPSSVKSMFMGQLTQHSKQNQVQIYQLLQLLSNEDTVQLARDMMLGEKTNFLSSSSVQEQFLMHMKQFLSSVGLNEEFVLRNKLLQQPLNLLENDLQTIKSLLLQLNQEDNSHANGKTQTLLHFINGMQLKAIQESTNFMQASLQLPGEKIGLHKDLFIQFEGRKKEDGQFDPDFCRILFILDLKQLQETVIDMHVQKRIISITIFNDSKQPTTMETFKRILVKNLEQIDYQLSTIHWKPLYKEKDRIYKHEQPIQQASFANERYDLRI